MTGFETRLLSAADKAEWRLLFDAYADFYRSDMSDTIADAVWDWLMDPDHVLEGVLVRNDAGDAVGFVHVRSCPRPLGGCDIGFVDDMYVLSHARGSGAADALFEHLRGIAAGRGWPAVRWVTQHFNARGRGFYDRYTDGASDFILYQWRLP